MRITVKLIDKSGRPIKGVVQVGDQALETVDGVATFSIKGKGEYVVRGLAMNHHIESTVVELKKKNQDISLELR
ncbi:hypothetical protein [Desulfosporosinus sp. Sb-LF]|uniref:hypothetical protein n=1 Tax=Desulfosporosinus sp. Sb-LF TaxID=2560027 RepID=UPI00107F5D12|nr:hypothetical protein [Desulfosporosinus sp. Sb-LF]TGE31337.1 hypothetical protein E4K68_17945 [Desulfosporosinus sp. Sb-LF]